MKRSFELKIELGNDSMQSGADVARALMRVANVLDVRTAEGLRNCASGIWDANGNKVGRWRVKETK